MGLLSDIFGLIGAGSQRKAADRASSVQVDAANSGINAVSGENTRVQSLLSPYGQAGDSSVNALMALLGLGPVGSQGTAIDSLKSSPLYASLMRNGNENILQNASATGGLRGGNVQHSLADFGVDTLSKVIENQIGHLGGLAGLGLQGIGESGAFGSRSAEDLAQLFQQRGLAQAGGILGKEAQTQKQWGFGGDMLSTILGMIGGGGGGGGTIGNLVNAASSRNMGLQVASDLPY